MTELPPGMNTDQTIGYIAATVANIQNGVDLIREDVRDHERRITSIEHRTERQAGASAVLRFLTNLPGAVLGALAGFLSGRAS